MTITHQYFVRSGYIRIGSGRLRSMGDIGHDWSSRAAYSSAVSAAAYYLWLNAFEVYPTRGPYERWFGLFLRRLGSGEGKLIQRPTGPLDG